MQRIDFQPDIFLDWFKPYIENDDRYLVMYGSRDSGKSVGIALKQIMECLSMDYFRGILIKKTAESIKDAQWQTIKDLVYEYDLEHLFEFKVSPLEIECVNGNKWIARGCDKPEKIKSVKDPNRAWYEELDQISMDEFLTITTTLRSSKSKVQEVMSFNPEIRGVAKPEDFWIYKMFFEGHNELTFSSELEIEVNNNKLTVPYTVVHSSYKDNPYCPPERYAIYENLKKVDPYRHKVYAQGLWASKKAESPYLNAFDENLNVSKQAVFQPMKTIRLSFDFNVDNCVCVLSHSGIDYIHFFDELISDNLPNLLKLVERTYGAYKASFMITGDRSGKARHHLVSDNMNSYRMIKQTLLLKDRQFNIKTNPHHSENRFTCNTILSYHPNVLFHPDMKETIYDMLYVECDQNEGIIKKDRNVSNQKADLLDCFTGDTLIEGLYGSKLISDFRIGDWVVTRNGFKTVIDRWSSMAEVCEFKLSNGDKIKCTKDHRFYVHNFGFLPIFVIFALKLNLCKLNITESYTGSIQSKSTFIAHSLRRSIPGVFTGRFGLIIMALYRKVGKCIIKMGMLLTMTLRILRLLAVQNICVIMQIKGSKKILSSFKGWQKQEGSMLENGTAQKKVLNGTNNMLKKQVLEREHLVGGIVSYAIKSMKERILIKSSAQTNVKPNIDCSLGLTILTRFVNIAMGYLSRTNTEKQDSAQSHAQCQIIGMKSVGKKKVYDITVDNCPEFYANGYLAHNCVRYTFNTFHAGFVKKYRFKKTA